MTPDYRVIEWLCTGDIGTSSKTLCGCLYGIPPRYKFDSHPHDPSDFSRCKGFIDLLNPEDKKAVFSAAITISPQWKALIERWDCLERMYNEKDRNMYKQMQKIIKGAI